MVFCQKCGCDREVDVEEQGITYVHTSSTRAALSCTGTVTASVKHHLQLSSFSSFCFLINAPIVSSLKDRILYSINNDGYLQGVHDLRPGV
jgi:hypothetical protein